MIWEYMNNIKKETSKTILVVALILSLFSGFTSQKSSATTSKIQSEWVVRGERKLNLISAFKLNSAQSLTSFSYHSQVTRLLFQNRLVDINLKTNKNQFSLIDLSFQLSHVNTLPLSSDEDYLLV